MKILQVGTLLCVLLLTDAKRIRVRGPVRVAAAEADQEEQPQQQQQVVYSDDAYNGLYGQLDRADEQVQRPAHRTAIAQPQRVQARVKDTPREPPVETIRNYSNINDDGSFTFGYESADGSFKEETRGTDCVVRGKYGYVDPDGNKREFTYVSGNPCDPNAPKDEDEEKEAVEESGEENIPQNVGRPLRPLRPQVQQRPQPARPVTSVFQNAYNSVGTADDEDEVQQQQVYVQPAVRQRLPAAPRPANLVRVTPRPQPQPTPLPATTYRPQLSVSVTPRPNVVLHKHTTLQPSSTLGSSNFDQELQRFQSQFASPVTTPRGFASPSPVTAKPPTGQPLYTSELVFDPSTGQYNTVVYQQVPKGEANTLTTRLPQYVQPSAQPQYVTPTPPQPQNSQIQQQLFAQKNQALFQQSQDLYNQQRLQQLQVQAQPQHRFQQQGALAPAATRPLSTSPQKFQSSLPQLAPQPQRLRLPQPPQQQQYQGAPQTQYYFASPQQDIRGSSTGQIDAFLRNFNLN